MRASVCGLEDAINNQYSINFTRCLYLTLCLQDSTISTSLHLYNLHIFTSLHLCNLYISTSLYLHACTYIYSINGRFTKLVSYNFEGEINYTGCFITFKTKNHKALKTKNVIEEFDMRHLEMRTKTASDWKCSRQCNFQLGRLLLKMTPCLSLLLLP